MHIAMLATGEGALVEVNSILLRMRELAVQGSTESVTTLIEQR